MFFTKKTFSLLLGVGVPCLSILSTIFCVSPQTWAETIKMNSKGINTHSEAILQRQKSQDFHLTAPTTQVAVENSTDGLSLENRHPGAKSSANPKDLLDRTGGMPMGIPPVPVDEEIVDSETSIHGPSLENRHPGAKSSANPKDLLDRTGGMPMDVPPVLDIGETPREKGILRRQQILNRFNPAFGGGV